MVRYITLAFRYATIAIAGNKTAYQQTFYELYGKIVHTKSFVNK